MNLASLNWHIERLTAGKDIGSLEVVLGIWDNVGQFKTVPVRSVSLIWYGDADDQPFVGIIEDRYSEGEEEAIDVDDVLPLVTGRKVA